MRSVWFASLCLATLLGPALSAPPPALSAKEQAAVFAAAGFKAKGGKFVRCNEDPPTPSYVPGSIEVADLNHDGLPEAWVVESSTSCYGMTGEAFVLVTRDATGAWRKILDEVGIADVKQTKGAGWPDIEVGGPGMGPFPRFHYNGTKYVAAKS
jgi:hypothetical protein